MAVTSTPYKIGADGKLYFKYNRGAEYKVKPLCSAPFVVCVLACEFDEDNGKEYYRIKSAGKELPARFTVSQVDLLLSQFPCTQSKSGEPQELPLFLNEVQEFYEKKRAMRDKENVAENKKLKGTAWNRNKQTCATLKDNLFFYRSCGNAAKVAELEKQLAELEAVQAKILEEKGVNFKILTKAPDCIACNDMGIIDGKICECARKAAAVIKSYCAAKRLNTAH